VWWKRTRLSTGIEERMETLERAMRALQLDWDDAYDKMRTLTARFTKRAQQIEKHELTAQPENGSTTGSPTAMSTLDPVSRRILDRRQRLFARQPPEEGTRT
jgi:phage shock protein A